MKEEHTHRLFELILAHADGAKVKPIEVFREVNAIEIPENATNGDVIKAMFPSAKIEESTLLVFMFAQGFDVSLIDSEWWDAPYRKESEETV